MTGESLPASVAALIVGHIDSVLQLELLLMLSADAARGWTAGQGASALGMAEAWVESQLVVLAGRGFLAAEGGQFRFRPASPELGAAVAELGRAYAQRRVSVITAIYSRHPSALQSFTDAFRLRSPPLPEKSDG